MKNEKLTADTLMLSRVAEGQEIKTPLYAMQAKEKLMSLGKFG